MIRPFALSSFERPDELAEAASRRIAELARAALRERGRAAIALSGGATPQRAYAKLSRAPLEWSRVSVTPVDDLWVPASDPRSNRNLLEMTLLYDGAQDARLVPLYTGDATPEAGAAAAERALGRMGLPFDLVVLGMGMDGHTASFFPTADRLAEALDPDGPRLVLPMRSPGSPEPRVTLTLAAMLQARRLLLLFSGEAKRAAFQRALENGPVEEMPIRAILRQRRTPLEVLCAREGFPSVSRPAKSATAAAG